jgi:hypothetical protein
VAVAVFGISGRTGQAPVAAAQLRGLELAGLARRPLDEFAAGRFVGQAVYVRD